MLEIEDHTNNIKCEVVLDPDQRLNSVYAKMKDGVRKMGSWFKLSSKKKQKRPSDSVDISIFQIVPGMEEKLELCTGTGSYVEFVSFDDKPYWRYGEKGLTWEKMEDENFLPSDSAF